MIAARRSIAGMLADWDRRLADTPSGRPALLLENVGNTVERRPHRLAGRMTP